MDLHADPGALACGADRLTSLACELMAAADRLAGLTGDASRSRPGGLGEHCAALGTGLRSDAAELLGCADQLRQDRAALLAAEASALIAVTGSGLRLPELPGWAR